jgi:thiamine kinase-like enzyme
MPHVAAQHRELLNSFVDTKLEKVEQDLSGLSGSTTLTARFCPTAPGGLDGVYVVKIGSCDGMGKEESFFHSAASKTLLPYLAPIKACSRCLYGMIAVAYDFVGIHPSSAAQTPPLSLQSLLENARDGDAVDIIGKVSAGLTDWYLTSLWIQEEAPFQILRRMLGEKRLRDTVTRLEHYLRDWPSDQSTIVLQGEVAPNPLYYLNAHAWRTLSTSLPCPVGYIHGDLHADNILISLDPDSKPKIIDFEDARPDSVPYFDLAYLQLDIIRHALPLTDSTLANTMIDDEQATHDWLEALRHPFGNGAGARVGLSQGGIGDRCATLIHPLQQQARTLQTRVSRSTTSKTHAQQMVWALACVAVGLNYARKSKPVGRPVERKASLLYAAFALRQFFTLWGEHVGELPRDTLTSTHPYEIHWRARQPIEV